MAFPTPEETILNQCNDLLKLQHQLFQKRQNEVGYFVITQKLLLFLASACDFKEMFEDSRGTRGSLDY